MKNTSKFLLYLAIGLFMGCKPDLRIYNCRVDMLIDIDDPTRDIIAGYQIVTANVSTFNMNTEDSSFQSISIEEFPYSFHVSLHPGYYNIDFNAKLLDQGGNEINLIGYYKGLSIGTEDELKGRYEIKAKYSQPSKDFVISELFVSGTINPASGKQYTGDKYFVISNNSEDTLFCDGLLLLESKLLNTTRYTLSPDFRDSIFAVQAIYQIPGSGSDYPVFPGASILIADNAMDHTKNNVNSFDLSSADFEWYDVSSVASVIDVDNPQVTNLNKIFCYTNSIWIPNNQGNKTYAIGRIPDSISKETFLKDYVFNFNYQVATSAGTYKMNSSNTYKIPNDWIIDAVNLCPKTQFQWTAISVTYDAGFAYVSETGDDKNRYGRCTRRRTITDQDNRVIFLDRNNSSSDFLPAQPADPYYFKSR